MRDVFVTLHEKGLVYRGNRIINWCPRCLTALSDEEAEPEETQGKLYHLRYPLAAGVDGGDLPRLADGRAYLTVATTRPETMLGDVAVAVHPDDERYQHLIGQELELPLVGTRIAVIADDQVDPEFGTGAVKITPAHDPNDFEMGQRHGLPSPNVMTPEATLNESVPEEFRGLDRFEARQRVIAAFQAAGPAGPGAGTPARRAALLPVQHGGGAAPLRPVVRTHAAAGGAGARRLARRARPLPPGALHQGVRELAREHP